MVMSRMMDWRVRNEMSMNKTESDQADKVSQEIESRDGVMK